MSETATTTAGDDWLAEPEPVETKFPTPAQRRFLAAAIAAIAAPILFDWPLLLLAEPAGPNDDAQAFFFSSLATAKFLLLSIWLAWGGSRVIWRLLVVLVSSAVSALILSGAAAPQISPILPAIAYSLIGTSIFAMPLAMPRAFGVRWIILGSGDYAAACRQKTQQFTIVDLLVWITVVAIFAAIIRGLDLPAGVANDEMRIAVIIGMLIGGFIIALVAAPLLLLVQWAVLAPTATPAKRITVVAASGLTISLLAELYGRASGAGPDDLVFLFAFGFWACTSFWIVIVLALLRARGHRLIRCKKKTTSLPSARPDLSINPPPIPRTSPHDKSP